MKRKIALAVAVIALMAFPSFVLAADATVTGHEAFSEDANHASYWETGDLECDKIFDSGDEDGPEGFVLEDDYALVIVKAGAGEFANTLFADASAGETVWADTNGDGINNPGGKDGDKNISHVIVCTEEEEEATPTPTLPDEATPTPTLPDNPTPTLPDEATPTPEETLPTTDTESDGSGGNSGLALLLILLAVGAAGMVVLSPKIR